MPHHSDMSPMTLLASMATMRFVPMSARLLSTLPWQVGTPVLMPEVVAHRADPAVASQYWFVRS